MPRCQIESFPMGPDDPQPYLACRAISLWRLPCAFLPSKVTPLSDSLLASNLAEGFIEETDTLVHVGFANIHGRGHADGVAVEAAFADEQAVGACALHDLICFLRGGLFGLAIFYEFERLQQA